MGEDASPFFLILFLFIFFDYPQKYHTPEILVLLKEISRNYPEIHSEIVAEIIQKFIQKSSLCDYNIFFLGVISG